MSDLIQRLNGEANRLQPNPDGYSLHPQAYLMRQAAAEIERLERDFRAAIETSREQSAMFEKLWRDQRDTLLRMESAERQRDEAIAALRELLRLNDYRGWVCDETCPHDHGGEFMYAVSLTAARANAWESARRLLNQKEGT